MRRVLLAGVCLALTTLAGGCSKSEFETYCDEVDKHQQVIAEAAAEDPATFAIAVLPAYRDLRDAAPSDIKDDWARVVSAIDELESAISAAGMDPETYDPAATDGLSQAEVDRIGAAAAGLQNPKTLTAMDHVEQQALDVCHKPLSL